MGDGVPHLLTIDDPLVAVAHGLRGEAGEVAASARFAEQLTPALFAREHWPKQTSPLFVGAVCDDGRTRQGREERGGIGALRAGRAQPLLHYLLEIWTYAQSAESDGEVNPCEASVVLVASELGVIQLLGIVGAEQRCQRTLDSFSLGRGSCVNGHDTILS